MAERIFCIKAREGIILRNKEVRCIFTHLNNFSKTHFHDSNIIRLRYEIGHAKFKASLLIIAFRCGRSNKNRNCGEYWI